MPRKPRNPTSDAALQALADPARAQQKIDFLAAFADRFNIGVACEISGVSRRTVAYWRKQDEHFAEVYNEIYRSHIDNAEETLFEIGMDSQLNPNARVNALIQVLFAHREGRYKRPGSDRADPVQATGPQNFTFQLVMGPKPVEDGQKAALPEPNVIESTFVDDERSEVFVDAPSTVEQDVSADTDHRS